MRLGKPIPPVVANTILPAMQSAAAISTGAHAPHPDAIHAELSCLAYIDLKTAERWLASQGFSDIQSFDRKSTQAIGCVSNGIRYLAFRGTTPGIDFLVDANLLLYGSPPMHFGFLWAWNGVRVEVMEWLKKGEATSTFHLTGHSLGGVLAVVAAYELHRQNFPIDKVVTFGCPRVGSAEFGYKYRQSGLTDRTTQYQYDTDSVCWVPPPLLFVHATELKGRQLVPKGPARILGQMNRLPPPSNPIGSINDAVWIFSQAFCPVLFVLNQTRTQNPEEPWLNPQKTSLGKSYEIAAVVLFWLCLLSALAVFSSANRLALVVSNWIPLAVFQLLGVLAFQQVIYLLLWSMPFWPRLGLSIVLASTAGWVVSGGGVSVSAVSGLVTAFGAVLLVLYRFVSGVTDHFMNNYREWLGARDVAKLAAEFEK